MSPVSTDCFLTVPRGGSGDLVNVETVRERDAVEDRVVAFAYGERFRRFAFRVNDEIGAVSAQEFFMDIPVRFAENGNGSELLEQAGDLQTRLEIVADADKAGVERRDVKRFQRFRIGTVADLRADAERQNVLKSALVDIDHHQIALLL